MLQRRETARLKGRERGERKSERKKYRYLGRESSIRKSNIGGEKDPSLEKRENLPALL